MKAFIVSIFIVGLTLISCSHHTQCPTYANSGTSNSKHKASCPTYASSSSSSSRMSKKKRSCPTYAGSSSSASKSTSKKKKTCPTYASSVQGHNKNNKNGLAPWTKKAKEQDKKKATSGLLPNQH